MIKFKPGNLRVPETSALVAACAVLRVPLWGGALQA